MRIANNYHRNFSFGQKHRGNFRAIRNKDCNYNINKKDKNNYYKNDSKSESKVNPDIANMSSGKFSADSFDFGCDVSANYKEMSQPAQPIFDEQQKEYEGNLSKAFSKNDVKTLVEKYSLEKMSKATGIDNKSDNLLLATVPPLISTVNLGNNVSRDALKDEKIPDEIFVKKLTDAEFQEMLPRIKKEFDKDNEQIKFNKNNILIADKFLSDKKFYNNPQFAYKFGKILNKTETFEQAQAKIFIMDKFLSDEKLYKNSNLLEYFGHILDYVDTYEQAKTRIDILDKFLFVEQISKNQHLTDYFGSILGNTKTDNQIILTEKLLSDEKLYGNVNLVEWFESILYAVKTAEQAESIVDIIDIFLADEKLYKNSQIVYNLGCFLNFTKTHEQFMLTNKFLSDEKLFHNKILIDNFWKFLTFTKNNLQFKIVNEFLSNEKLYNNKKLVQNLGGILNLNLSPEHFILTEKFLSNEKLYDNQNLLDKFVLILLGVGNEETANMKIGIINKFLSDEELYNNERVCECLGAILECVRTPEQYNLAEKLLSDEKLYKNKILVSYFGKILNFTQTPEQILLTKNLLSRERLYNNPDFVQRFCRILSGTKTMEEAKVKINVLDLYSSDKEADLPQNIVNFIINCKIISQISPFVLVDKTKKFLDLGLEDSFIKNILENSKSLTFYSDEVIRILLQRKKTNPEISTEKIIKAILGNIPNDLQDRIDTLILLAKLSDEEISIFKKYGVDVNERIKQLEKLINAKHQIISTTQADINTFFKAFANTKSADDIIKNADFEQFGTNGIQLNYPREEFIRRMNELSSVDLPKLIQSSKDVTIPKLQITEDDIIKSKEVLESYKTEYSNNIKEYNAIVDGKKTKIKRFCGSKTGGSNEGDFGEIDDKLYYIKFPDIKEPEQSVQEFMASEFYRAAGIDSPNMKIILDEDGKILCLASEYIPDNEGEAHCKKLFDSFATDAWLANWDAPKNGNSIIKNGRCLKIDTGGSMDYRAKKGKKDNFMNVVDELTSLIEQNDDYAKITKADVMLSIRHVTNITDQQVWKIIENVPSKYRNYALGKKMLARRDFIREFGNIFQKLDETNYDNILDMINHAKLETIKEFDIGAELASLLGYEQTEQGFEGLLNTQDLSKLSFKPDEYLKAQKMVSEIEKFTRLNSVADDVPLSDETKNFLNSILKGIPEFAACFGKPQQSDNKYSLDVHLLKVLQDALKDPDYEKLNNQDKLVLKFSALLHDIGKRQSDNNSDMEHVKLSAEYVYSILDRFKLDDYIKDRIISIVGNHHWLESYKNGIIDEETVATLARRPNDWLIYKIITKADLQNTSEDYAATIVKGAVSKKTLSKIFEEDVSIIEEQIQKIRKNMIVVTPTKWIEVPERTTPSGEKLEARTFDIEEAIIDGVKCKFKVLNLNEKSDEKDMFKYGFNHFLKKEDLRFIVHMPGDGSDKYFNVFKTLVENPLNNSTQSLSIIDWNHTQTYNNRLYGFVVNVDNVNISNAYPKNIGSGMKKNMQDFVCEIFKKSHYRNFVKKQFVYYFKTKCGIDIDDAAYVKIMEYIMNKKFPETQLKSQYKIGDKIFNNEDLLIGDKTYKIDDIAAAFKYSRDQLLRNNKGESEYKQNEIVGFNVKIKGLIAKVNSFKELPEYFLLFARDNNYPIILIRNR